MADYTLDELARFVDHTNLHAYANHADMDKLCAEAKQYHFKMVAINQVQSKYCSELLKGTDIDTGAAIAFPLGQTSIAAKEFETRDAIANGANEIDYVINQTELKEKHYAYIEDEMTRLTKICHDAGIPIKVIFENCYLTKDEIVQVATIARRVQPDFIKTATGFGTGGATVADVQLMKQTVGPDVQVKAAGGIRNSDDFLAMIAAGATRIGTSSGVKIIDALRQRMADDHVTTIHVAQTW
ncbi:deoxyribose-phosphate aldolase [Lacticaseibacillus sharpeae]|uniref:Deoxyribose-phosphate aldolase n=1 Tax=Lacticaseibacillus sharpeae JCM 1186 = DSM 20505 TaxID=1291052 RepID=A0A0R1ZTY9_9LACO|nr:deoxyribose-phosphate aldolase [Lacticaseibacillus sharpeae]KRM54387.1 deoxyribose-phosphate aldolase [Lacticaseibacillus sharpeae JCM 1186 = DSM 20505]